MISGVVPPSEAGEGTSPPSFGAAAIFSQLLENPPPSAGIRVKSKPLLNQGHIPRCILRLWLGSTAGTGIDLGLLRARVTFPHSRGSSGALRCPGGYSRIRDTWRWGWITPRSWRSPGIQWIPFICAPGSLQERDPAHSPWDLGWEWQELGRRS